MDGIEQIVYERNVGADENDSNQNNENDSDIDSKRPKMRSIRLGSCVHDLHAFLSNCGLTQHPLCISVVARQNNICYSDITAVLCQMHGLDFITSELLHCTVPQGN